MASPRSTPTPNATPRPSPSTTAALAADEAYLYAYYHKAVSQQELGDIPGAKATLGAGLKAARKAGDAKAQSEMQTLLDMLG